MDVTIRSIDGQGWPAFARLAGRAFWTEEYMLPLAADPIARYAITQDAYLGMKVGGPGDIVLGAFASDRHPAGFAWITRPGDCSYCGAQQPTDEGDPVAAYFAEVGRVIAGLHQTLPPHWNIGPIAVEPTLQGLGIGHRLMDAALKATNENPSEVVALDCDPRLEGFYERSGFRRFAVGTDRWGFDIVGMCRDPEGA
jgi:GNAT superfamily N-acetyltransferase